MKLLNLSAKGMIEYTFHVLERHSLHKVKDVFLFYCREKQEGMVQPRNFRSQDCPSLS